MYDNIYELYIELYMTVFILLICLKLNICLTFVYKRSWEKLSLKFKLF